MANQTKVKIKGDLVDAYDGTGKRGDFHTAVMQLGREVKLFSDVSLVAQVGKQIEAECVIAPDFSGNATIRIVGFTEVK